MAVSMLPRAGALRFQGLEGFGDAALIAVQLRQQDGRVHQTGFATPSLGEFRSRALWINPGSSAPEGGAALLNRPTGRSTLTVLQPAFEQLKALGKGRQSGHPPRALQQGRN